MADNTEEIAALDVELADAVSSVSTNGVTVSQDLAQKRIQRDMLSRTNSDPDAKRRRMMNPVDLSRYTQ